MDMVSRCTFEGEVLTVGDNRHKREERRTKCFDFLLCDVLWRDGDVNWYQKESRGTGLILG